MNLEELLGRVGKGLDIARARDRAGTCITCGAALNESNTSEFRATIESANPCVCDACVTRAKRSVLHKLADVLVDFKL